MQGIKLKYKASTFQIYFNHDENILVKYYFRPINVHCFDEFHTKKRKINKMSSQSKKIGSFPNTGYCRTRQAMIMWNYYKISPVVVK